MLRSTKSPRPWGLVTGGVSPMQGPLDEWRRRLNSLIAPRAPVTSDGSPPGLGVAPEFGQHTEEILLEVGA